MSFALCRNYAVEVSIQLYYVKTSCLPTRDATVMYYIAFCLCFINHIILLQFTQPIQLSLAFADLNSCYGYSTTFHTYWPCFFFFFFFLLELMCI